MLRTRLTLGLLPLLLLFMAVCGYAFRTSRELGSSAGEILSRSFHSIQVEQTMRDAASRMRDTLAPDSRSDLRDATKRFEASRGAFKRSLNDERLGRPGPQRGELLSRLDEQFEVFARAGEAALRSIAVDARALYPQAQSALFGVNRAIDALRELDYIEIRDAGAHVTERTEATLRLLLLAICASILLFFFLAWRLTNSLVRPIKAVTTSAVALGEGDLDREVPVNSRDEIGQLAKAFNTMATRLRDYREATVAKVLRTQRTMEATLTSTPDPVFVVSSDGLHTMRNPAAEQLAGSAQFAQGFPPALAEPLARVFATGEHYLPTDYRWVVTLHVQREDRHYLPRILAVGDKLTAFTGAAVILQDVTKFRLLDDAKTNLVGTVSHELKTPLTSLRMAIYLLLEKNVGEITARQRDLLETARDDADRLLRILDNLLDLSRLEGCASELDRREVRVGMLVSEIANEARAFIEAAKQTLQVEIEPGLEPALLTVDVDRLRHVFINLLTNASKYSPEGSAITLGAGMDPAGFVRFAVRDEGPGIAAADSAHVFDRFYRVPGQSKKPGVGLGLAIAREIVVAHGGSIACESGAGQGAEFYFLIPH